MVHTMYRVNLPEIAQVGLHFLSETRFYFLDLSIKYFSVLN